MSKNKLTRKIYIPPGSTMEEAEYIKFLEDAYKQFFHYPQYFADDEGINTLELAHLIPEVSETVLAIYVGINDAVCNKGLITPFLVRHGHNNVFVFDPLVYSGGKDVPDGTIDARKVLSEFEPPNSTWNAGWTYVMIEAPKRTFESLWKDKGYIDMIPAKFEDFTMLSDPAKSKVCIFIDPKAFSHPVNKNRKYLKAALNRGEKMIDEFAIPEKLKGEMDGLAAVVLHQGEKLYVATNDFSPCAHGWSNIHPDNMELAVINETSAVPLDLIIAKPPVRKQYVKNIVPPRGSADMTTDWFKRGSKIVRNPLLQGLFKG